MLGALVNNKTAEYSPDDERCHTGMVKEFEWSVLKDLENSSKFMKALEKDPVDNEGEFASIIHSNFVSVDKEFSELTEYVMGKPFTADIGNVSIAGVKINAPPKKMS